MSNFLPEDRLSASVRRVIAASQQLARRRSSVEVDVADLIMALDQEESRGSEILRGANLSIDSMPQSLQTAAVSDDPSFDPPPLSEQAAAAVHAAVRLMRRSGTESEAGTDHLLFALAEQDAAVAQWLAEASLTVETLRERLLGSRTGDSARIETDLSLDPDLHVDRDRDATLRAIDAAANRASEGLRVVEDFTRFVLNDRLLTEQLKSLRHHLAAALQAEPFAERIVSRDTQHDVGTLVSTESESHRASSWDVSVANLKRVQESLRTLEEFGKTLDSISAAKFEQLRYESYTIEQNVARRRPHSGDWSAARLYWLVTPSAIRGDWTAHVAAALEGGVDVVQLREKDASDRQLILMGRTLRRLTHAHRAKLILNDRPDLAVVLDADGVHLGQDDMPVAAARGVVGAHRSIGVSTRTIEQVRQAVQDSADYIGIGPTFPSRTKEFGEFAGLDFIEAATSATSLPAYAIGGIGVDNVAEVIAHGGRRIAVSHVLNAAEDPAEVAAALQGKLTEAARRGASAG